MKTGPKPIPLADRLMEKVTKQPDGCWIFNGAKYSSGYGVIKGESKEIIGAHRASYIVNVGNIPKNKVVMHVCDVKLCVNPEHLKLGTPADNLNDMRQKGRHSHGESHAEAIKRGWTSEKRAKRAKQTAERRRNEYRQRQTKAGVPFTWKFCAKSNHWIPRSKFGKNSARHDGLNVYCNSCRS